MATGPQAPVTESQATAGAARDEAAKGQARLTTHGAEQECPRQQGNRLGRREIRPREQ